MNSTLNTAGMISHSESRAYLVYAVIIPFGIISTILVILRIYTRSKILKVLKVDDILMILAQILIIGGIIITAMAIKYGLGRHVWTLDPNSVSSFLKILYSSVYVYTPVLNTVKLSILFQIRRIFIGRKIQIVTLITIIFIILWTITSMVVQSYICIPLSAVWNRSIHGKCLNREILYLFTALINILADFVILVIPLPVIETLQLPKKQKIMLYFIFSLGFFACCVSILRIHTIVVSQHTKDPTWDAIGLVNWSLIEVSTAIISACFPTLRPILQKFMPSIFATTSSTQDIKSDSQITKQPQGKSGNFSETIVENIYGIGSLQDDCTVQLHETKIHKLEV